MQVYLASYKARRKGWQGVFNKGVQWLTKSQYSHSELCLGDPFENLVACISASGVDGGVRSKLMQLNPPQLGYCAHALGGPLRSH